MKRIIELTPLCEIGKGSAKVTEDSVQIEVQGISGGMKAWLVGGEEAEKIGNIVDGKLFRSVDTTRHNGILITQSGRQILMGAYSEKIFQPEKITEEKAPFETEGIDWRKMTGKNYGGLCEELRYILSNESSYQSYKRHGHYWAGESETSGALAFKIEENEENPLARFSDMCEYKNGYVMVCIDKKTKKIKKLF